MPNLRSIALAAGLLVSAAASAQSPAAPTTPPEQWTIIHCGSLLAIPGRPPLANASVIVKDQRINAVREGFVNPDQSPAPPGATVNVIDLKNRFVLPGLIDCHVHLTHQTSPDARLQTVTMSDADAALNAVVYSRKTLDAGFTSVRDLGASGDTIFAVRDAINDGRIPGPRICAAGKAISPTGGHGDKTNSFRPDVFDLPGPIQGIADGPDACRQAVRNQVKRGADCIKLTATGGVLSNIGAGLEQQFFDDELAAIIDTGHLLKKKVAAHAHGVNGINAALRAGVDSIEHGTYLDDESIRLFKEKGAYYVPTITAGKSVEEYARTPGYYIPQVMKKAQTVGPLIQEAFARAYKAGVKIAFGTDAGVFPHGDNWRELLYMADAGMKPDEIIKSATVNAADLLDWSNDVGSIEPGKYADLIAVTGDPLRDIAVLKNIDVVIKSGEIAKDARR
ncbi:MAG: amidohydrolase family protein [Phycisphaerae bacterium]|nr:amidohydrolase family protein [Phycisphaerae bacterium]